MAGGRLTTHVLDTAHGRPAAGMSVELSRLLDDRAELLLATETDGDGRCARPLLEGTAFAPGQYELRFGAGPYFRGLGVNLPDPAFLETVVVRFGLSAPSEHYHVPLLVSPFAYSTYRGS